MRRDERTREFMIDLIMILRNFLPNFVIGKRQNLRNDLIDIIINVS